MFQEMQVCESKPSMHKPVLLFGTMYQRLDDQTCITAFVANNIMLLCVDRLWLVIHESDGGIHS